MAYPCRCRKCGRRKSFLFQPNTYDKAPKCGCVKSRCKKCKNKKRKTDKIFLCTCKETDFRVDWYRYRKENKNPCKGGLCELHFPHRLGSKGCAFYETLLLDRVLKNKTNRIGEVCENSPCPF